MAWTKAQIAGTVALGATLIGGTTATVIYIHQPPTRVVLTPGIPLPGENAPSRSKQSRSRCWSIRNFDLIRHMLWKRAGSSSMSHRHSFRSGPRTYNRSTANT